VVTWWCSCLRHGATTRIVAGSMLKFSLEFFIDIELPAHFVPRVVTDSNRWVPRIFSGGKEGRYMRLKILSPSWADFLKSRNVILPETSGPLLTGNGIALPLPLDKTIQIIHISMLYDSAWIELRVHCYSVYRRICLREKVVAEFGGWY